jgi:(p)ppGpp synthase/HD superfamily hydrolase
LSNEGGVLDKNVLQAAILHDTVEDTDTTLEEIERLFGAKVRSIVDEVTDDKALGKQERKEEQVKTTVNLNLFFIKPSVICLKNGYYIYSY